MATWARWCERKPARERAGCHTCCLHAWMPCTCLSFPWLLGVAFPSICSVHRLHGGPYSVTRSFCLPLAGRDALRCYESLREPRTPSVPLSSLCPPPCLAHRPWPTPQGYARSDNPLEALSVADEMALLGFPLERVAYNSLVLACVRAGDMERALDLVQDMKVRGRGEGERRWKDGDIDGRNEHDKPTRCV